MVTTMIKMMKNTIRWVCVPCVSYGLSNKSLEELELYRIVKPQKQQVLWRDVSQHVFHSLTHSFTSTLAHHKSRSSICVWPLSRPNNTSAWRQVMIWARSILARVSVGSLDESAISSPCLSHCSVCGRKCCVSSATKVVSNKWPVLMTRASLEPARRRDGPPSAMGAQLQLQLNGWLESRRTYTRLLARERGGGTSQTSRNQLRLSI